MNTANFKAICARYCDEAGLPRAELVPDGDGLIAFHIEDRGVSVNVMHYPALAPDGVFVLFELGPMEGQVRDAANIMRALLRANFLSLPAEHPAFACHPLTGDAVLQCLYPLADAKYATFARLVKEGVALALQWREGFFLDSELPELPEAA